MINMFTIVGRIVSITSYGITIRVTVQEGEKKFHEAIIPVHISSSMKDNCTEYLKEGDICGVKGHFDATKTGKPIIFGERITFLSSNKEVKDE